MAPNEALDSDGLGFYHPDKDTNHIGFLIKRSYSPERTLTLEQYEEAMDTVGKALQEAGLPSLMDDWKAWHDNGAYYVGTLSTVQHIYDILMALPALGMHIYYGYDPHFFQPGDGPQEAE